MPYSGVRNLGTPVAKHPEATYAPGVVIVLGPQRYTVLPEHEAEVRRLLWAQLRPQRPRRRRARPRLRVIQGGRATASG